jgi:RNA polymerase sigma-70 factor (ECF subfamily)
LNVKYFKKPLGKDFSTYSDEKLVKLSAAANAKAFAVLVNKYKDDVAAIVKGMLGDVPEADDVGLEVFIRFYNSASKFRGDSHLKTYLTRIAINLSLNELKSRKNKYMLSIDDSIKENASITDEFSEKEIKDVVNMGLERLEAKFKSVLVLRLIQGYSTKEVAEILNLPLGTVLSRLSRAQQKLRDIILTFDKTYSHG